jgi:CRISPR type I-E-associated protein CasB/Cse2
MSDFNWDVELIEQLTKLADHDNPNRATMAHLRRGLDRPPDYILGRVGWLFRRVPDWALNDAVLAAELFAWVKGDCPQTAKVDFGRAFGAGLKLDQKQQREKRFIDLLDTDEEELHYKLRQAITLIGKVGVGLDWVLLIKHLGNWDHADRWVQKEWARGFWSAPVEEETTAPQTEIPVL